MEELEDINMDLHKMKLTTPFMPTTSSISEGKSKVWREQTRIHSNVIETLCNTLREDDFHEMKDLCKEQTYGGFGAGQLERITSLSDLLYELELKRIFKEGDYVKLKQLLKDIGNERAKEKVEEAEKHLAGMHNFPYLSVYRRDKFHHLQQLEDPFSISSYNMFLYHHNVYNCFICFKVVLSNILSDESIMSLATFFNFPPGIIGQLQDNSYEFVHELEKRHLIQNRDMSGLVDALSKLKLHDLQKQVEFLDERKGYSDYESAEFHRFVVYLSNLLSQDSMWRLAMYYHISPAVIDRLKGNSFDFVCKLTERRLLHEDNISSFVRTLRRLDLNDIAEQIKQYFERSYYKHLRPITPGFKQFLFDLSIIISSRSILMRLVVFFNDLYPLLLLHQWMHITDNSYGFVLQLFIVGIVQEDNMSPLVHALTELGLLDILRMVEASFDKNRPQIHLEHATQAKETYGTFLASLSSHLTLSIPGQLCDYSNFTYEKKKAVITSQTPGLSFLLTLEEMGIINHVYVGALITPLMQLKLLQAVARVQEYQSLVDERNELKKPVNTLEEKRSLFIELLKRKIKNWYETMTPLPWKSSCQWKTSDLFINCGLILTDSSKLDTSDITPEHKLQYTDIFTHRKLEKETRIIVEGDAGSGKTMLLSQLAYDWSTGKMNHANMVIFLPLKFVEDMTIIQAIERFYIPKDKPLDEDDIEAVLDQASEENKTYIVLDALEEYNGRTNDEKPSEVVRVMRKEKFPKCTVVLTARSSFVHDLPQCPMLKLGGFGKEERDLYIETIIPEDKEEQQKLITTIENSAFLLDVCSTALLFVYVVHNIENLVQLYNKDHVERVGPFMQAMIDNLLSLTNSEYTEGDKQREKQFAMLSEIAFNGLCKGHQQLMWQKTFFDKSVSNMKDLVESGIIVVEEVGKEGWEVMVKSNDWVRSKDYGLSTSEEDVGKDEGVRSKDYRLSTSEDDVGKDEGVRSKDSGMSMSEEDVVKDGGVKSKSSGLRKSEEDVGKDGGVRSKEYGLSTSEEDVGKDEGVRSKDSGMSMSEEDVGKDGGIKSKSSGLKKSEEDVGKDEGVRSKDSGLSTSEKVEVMDERVKSKSSGMRKSEEDVVMDEGVKSKSSWQRDLLLRKKGLGISYEKSRQKITSRLSDLQKVSLQVKFLHKVIQEWFAGKHLSSMFKHAMSENLHREFLERHLPLINPADLHCVLRFTSYLCPDSCHLIMEHLHSSYKPTEPGRPVPEYILNCIFLCFAEYNSSTRDSKMDDAVRQVCMNVVTIRGEDSRLLQQSKVSMLMYASKSEIPIGCLRLINLVVMVAETQLTFNSDITLELLPTLEVIEVSRWDPKLNSFYKNLMKFITRCKSVKEAYLHFPSTPPNIEEDTLTEIKSREMKFDWIIGEKFTQTLDLTMGEWMSQNGHGQTTSKDSHLRVELTVSKEGGFLEIPDTGVSLDIPPGALEDDQCVIQMRIILDHYQEEADLSFASKSSVVVELLPSNIKLLKPVTLTLPHCLILKKGSEWRARIYCSHHEEGSPPLWKEKPDTRYELREHNCVIWLQTFSWEKIHVGDEIVEGKEVFLYGAKRLCSMDTRIYLDIGYYPALPDGNEDLKLKEIAVLESKRAQLFKKGEYPLLVLLTDIIPPILNVERKKLKEISFIHLRDNRTTYCTFVLTKDDPKMTGECSCYFDVWQKPSDHHEIILPVKVSSPELLSISHSDVTTSRRQPTKLTLDSVVIQEDILHLSKMIGDDWKKVCRILFEGSLENIENDNKGQEEAAYQMFDKWKKKKGDDAIYKVLVDALTAADRKDLGDNLKRKCFTCAT